MSTSHTLKIDIFAHIIPEKFRQAIMKALPGPAHQSDAALTSLHDLDLRLRIMEQHEGLMQVLTLGMTSGMPEQVTDLDKSTDLAKLANDELAELVFKHPEKFPAAVATLPMNNINAALKELERAIDDLKFRGIQLLTPTNDKPLDAPEFMPIYEMMSRYNLPIWLHPCRGDDRPDYLTETKSTYRIASAFGWPYETSAAMTRLVFSGVLEKYPNLKFITHHAGGLIPLYAIRISQFHDIQEMTRRAGYKKGLTKTPIEYYKMFYADTALYGNTPGLMLAYSFFGPDHLLFGTDMPYDNQLGYRDVRETIWAIEEMDIGETERKKIFAENARLICRLPT